MNRDNLIIIKGGLYNDIKKALQQWIELYSNDLETDIKFELYKTGQGSNIIIADKRLTNEKFNFLVNYLRYPEGIKYNINIEGYTTAKDEKLFKKEILNKKLLIYISDNDKESDNVFALTEDNEVYKIDFGGKVSRINESKVYSLPNIDFKLLSKPEMIVFNTDELVVIKKEKLNKRIKKRFGIILSLIILVAGVNSLSLFIISNDDISIITTFILVFSVIIWFHSDYEMLRVDKYYNYSFLIAVANLIYGFLIKDYLPDENIFLYYGFYFPLVLLIVQKPLRLVFIRKFDREPIIERTSPFWDTIYGLTLIILTIGIVSLIALMT
jgi:hypothetical protein